MGETTDLPTPLPAPPRSVRANRQTSVNLGCGRVFILPFMVVGLAVLLAVPARLAVQGWGRPIDATVDALVTNPGRRGGSTNTVVFHYAIDGRRWDDNQEVTADEFARLHVGDRLDGRAVRGLGRSLALTSAGSNGRLTGVMALAAVIVNVVVGLFVYALYVIPWRDRRLIRTGTAVAGEVTGRLARRARGGAATTVTYQFHTPAGRFDGTVRVSGSDPDATRVGRPVTVVYDPGRPTRNVAYEFSGYTVAP